MNKLLINIVSVMLLSCTIVVILLYALHRPSNLILAQWQQPSSIQYDAYDPYYFSIVEADFDWKYFPFNLTRHHYIYVGREYGTPSYGHYLEFSFHPSLDSLKNHLKKSTVAWTADGVTFNEASGHRLFIPKPMFTGGR